MHPPQWGREGQELRSGVPAGFPEMVDGFVHVQHVLEDDGGNHEVEGDDAFSRVVRDLP